MPGFYDIHDDDEFTDLDHFNVHSFSSSSFFDPKWDNEESWDLIPFDANYAITNHHLWLVHLANYTFVTDDFKMSTETFDLRLTELMEDVPEIADYKEILLELYMFLDNTDNTRWLGIFRNHVFHNMPVGKALMDGYKSIQKESAAVRNSITLELEKSFFPEYSYLKTQDFSKYLDFFTEWYLAKYNKNYPSYSDPFQLDVEQEKWAFIDGHMSEFAHFKLARTIAVNASNLKVIYLYSFLAVLPKVSITIFDPKKKSTHITAPPATKKDSSTKPKANPETCSHEFMDIGDQTICIKCEATVRGNEEYGLHYP